LSARNAPPGNPTETTQFIRLKRGYLSVAVGLTNFLVIFITANLALTPFFLIRDSQSYRQWSPCTIASTTNGFFNKDGSPVDNGNRTQHQLTWADFTAYEKAEPDHVAAVLDDFTIKNARVYLSTLGRVF
jgi:hypothetical protein